MSLYYTILLVNKYVDVFKILSYVKDMLEKHCFYLPGLHCLIIMHTRFHTRLKIRCHYIDRRLEDRLIYLEYFELHDYS